MLRKTKEVEKVTIYNKYGTRQVYYGSENAVRNITELSKLITK